MAYTIAFFGTKPYDESSFTDKNKEFGFELNNLNLVFYQKRFFSFISHILMFFV